jgi:tetratricopeptide (TPR) repeat protein
VRVEFVRFLLAHSQPDRAASELLAGIADLPDTLAAHLQIARQFAAAGDHAHALDQFDRALHLDANSGEALAGAGESAFQLGRYTLARDYLRRAPANLDHVVETRTLVDRIVSSDPLANRIGTLERRRRLIADLTYLRQRLNDCAASHSEAPSSSADADVQAEAESFEASLNRASTLDHDTVEAGVELIGRLVGRVSACRPPGPLDRPLELMARQDTDNPQ